MGLIKITRCLIHLLLLLSICFLANAQNSANDGSMNDVFQDSDVAPAAPAHVPAHVPTHVPAHVPTHVPAHVPAQVPTHAPGDVPTYPPPIVLKVLIQEEGQPIFKLRWKKTEQIVANQNLPVWGAQCGETHDLKTKETEEILKHFVMYQDSEQDSAIVFVTNKDLIYGNVGTKYYIHALPLALLLEKRILKVGGPYVKKNPDSTTGVDGDTIKYAHKELSNDISPVAPTRNERNVVHPHAPTRVEAEKETTGKKFYVETLLFITHDIVAPIKLEHPEDYLFHILLNYAIYFNSMDMLLAKLPTRFRVYVNLAGIIFEEDPDVFSSVIKSSILDYEERNQSLVLEGFARLFSNYYLLDSDFVLPENSFDLVFISTSRELEFEEVRVLGQSFGGVDIYNMRQTRTHQMIGIPKSIVRNSDLFTSFAVAAHEIGNVFAYHDPEEEHCIEESQTQLPVCDHCLEWSPDTVEGIKKFMHGNRNRCWLLNYPKSLRQSNAPTLSLSPSEQCQCYGYMAFGKKNDMARKHIPYNACVRALSCVKVEKHNQIVEHTILPFDGTPCAKGGYKVCWRQKCVPVFHQKSSRPQQQYGWKSYSK